MAEAIDTGAVEAGTGVASTVLPESPMQKADVPNESPETPTENLPDAGMSDVAIYQDVIAKHADNPRYDMSDSEAEAFSRVNEQVMTGQMEDPGLKKSEEKSQEKAKAPEAKPETPEVKPEAETPSETATLDTSDMSMAQADALQKAMTQVGAKDIKELPGKVEGLINQMKSTGGKLGGEAKALQSQVDQNNSFMQALKAKDPQALAHFKNLMGYPITDNANSSSEGNKPQNSNGTVDLGDPSTYLDEKLAPVVQQLLNQVKELQDSNKALAVKDEGRDLISQQSRATNAWIDDVAQLVADHPDDFDINVGEARALAVQYWSPEGAKTAVHPKFQSLHELIGFAADNAHPDLNTAHVMMQHKNGSYAKKLIEARKNGADEASHTESPNAAISNQQGRTKTDVPNPTVTDDMVTAMEKGDLNAIPDSILDSWTDESGNFDRTKVPQRFHEQAFGRAG